MPDFDTAHANDALDLLEQLTITPSSLWYLYALALYFVIALAVRRLPMALVLGVALALSIVASAGLLEIPGNRGGVYQVRPQCSGLQLQAGGEADCPALRGENSRFAARRNGVHPLKPVGSAARCTA